MRIRATIEYDATPDEVFAMLSDRDFQDRKAKATGALEHEVSIATRGEETRIVSKRTMPTEDFPDFVKGMVGDRLPVTETHTWGPAAADGSRRGEITVAVGNLPVGLKGTLALAPQGEGTTQSVDGELKARIPIIGGKVEKAAAPAIEAAIDIERTTGRAWLAG